MSLNESLFVLLVLEAVRQAHGLAGAQIGLCGQPGVGSGFRHRFQLQGCQEQSQTCAACDFRTYRQASPGRRAPLSP